MTLKSYENERDQASVLGDVAILAALVFAATQLGRLTVFLTVGVRV